MCAKSPHGLTVKFQHDPMKTVGELSRNKDIKSSEKSLKSAIKISKFGVP